MTAGSSEGLEWPKNELLKVFKMTVTTIGGGPEDATSVRILNKLVEWVEGKGITYEADPRHAQLLIREMLGDDHKDKAGVTPGIRKTADSEEEVLKHIQELKLERIEGKKEKSGRAEASEKVHRYRSIAARGNFLSVDRVDVQYAVKEIARRMSAPEDKDEDQL